VSDSISAALEGAPVAPALPSPPLADASPLRLAWRALLLDERAYAAVAARTQPMRAGLLVLLWVLGVVLLARLIGFGLNWLTTPRLERIEGLLQEFITGLPWYADQVQQAPAFATQFVQTYFLSWEGLRALLGIQTPAATGLWAGATVLDTLLAWLGYGVLAHWSARWLHGGGHWPQTLGALALAYAPLLLVTIEVIPGASLPLGLLFLLMLVGKYQAIKSTHALSPSYTLAAVLLPYLLALLLLLAIAIFSAAFGLEQIPYFDQTVTALRDAFILWRLP
jgi:hypothetical protein